MRVGRCFRQCVCLCLGLGVCFSTGCQTWMGGMTLPSAEYLKDNPDYMPKPPAFPLPRELANMQADSAEASAAPTARPATVAPTPAAPSPQPAAP